MGFSLGPGGARQPSTQELLHNAAVRWEALVDEALVTDLCVGSMVVLFGVICALLFSLQQADEGAPLEPGTAETGSTVRLGALLLALKSCLFLSCVMVS